MLGFRALQVRPRSGGQTRSPELRVSSPRALLLRTHGYSAPTATTTTTPRRVRAPVVAISASFAISAQRPAMSECRCAMLAGAGLVSVPARERNQGAGRSGRGDGRPEPATGLAAGEERVDRRPVVETRVRAGARSRSERASRDSFCDVQQSETRGQFVDVVVARAAAGAGLPHRSQSWSAISPQ
jgi:hypothetical protein